MLLYRHRIVSAALHRRIVADDHRLPPRHPADAGDHARTGDLAAIKVAGSELADFEKGRTWIEQPLDPLTREQLAAAGVAFARLFIAAQRREIGRASCRERVCQYV